MGSVALAWYLSAALALGAVMVSAISWAPGPGPLERALPVVFAGGSLLAAGSAVGSGRLPPAHRVRRSRAAWAVFAVAAVTVTVLLVLVV